MKVVISKVFPGIRNSQVEKWLNTAVTLFSAFIITTMVSFTMCFANLAGDILKGELSLRDIFPGFIYCLFAMGYCFIGVVVIFLKGMGGIYGDHKK